MLHEYTSIEGVQEDVVEILLNLKGSRSACTRAKKPSCRCSKKGPGPVRAGDIIVDHDVEIVNPELVIANLTNAGELNMFAEGRARPGLSPGDAASRRSTSRRARSAACSSTPPSARSAA